MKAGMTSITEDCMRKKLVMSKPAGAVFRREGSTVWDVDFGILESAFELWVADVQSGNVLVRRPLESPAVSSIVDVVEGAIHDFGPPREIRTDASTVFTKREFYRLLHSYGIHHGVWRAGARTPLEIAMRRAVTQAEAGDDAKQ
jgi:hypothetical protein